MPNLTPATQKLIENYQSWYESTLRKEGVITIKVDEVAARLATFYEKIREVVDWREKHLMRRVAIERILKRRMLLKTNGASLAEPFVLELIRGGHLPNDWIEKTKIEKIKNVLDKYIFILGEAPSLPSNRTQSEFFSQILGLAACEAEETLDPAFYIRENALIEYMEALMKERMKIGKQALVFKNVSEDEKNIQIYIAVQQALFKLDSPIIIYNLLKRRYANWSNLTPEQLNEITRNIFNIWSEMDGYFTHFLADKFYKICEKYDTPYLLLGDIISEDPLGIEEKIQEPQILEKLIKKAYEKRRNTIKERMSRAAFYSVLSIFLSNIAVMYGIEFPVAKFLGRFTYLSMIVDVVGPTLLMWFIVASIRLPGSDNLKLVVEEIKKIVYGEQKDLYEVELYPRRRFISRLIFGLFYFFSFLICFGGMTYGMYKINYPPFSYLIMYMFVSLVAFAGMRIKQRSRELHVVEEKETLFNFIFTPLALPVIRMGKWLTARWHKINLIAVFFNWLIEAPFLVFVEFLEQWRYFLKEKREDIR